MGKYGKIPKAKRKALLTKADASYNLVYMLDLDRQKMVKELGEGKAEQAYSMAQTQAYLDAVDGYMENYGKSVF